mgnify:CR=1 FL=1
MMMRSNAATPPRIAYRIHFLPPSATSPPSVGLMPPTPRACCCCDVSDKA